MSKSNFTEQEASSVAKSLNLNFSTEQFSIKDFTKGMNVELEHGTKSKETNITNDDPILTGKIALAHLREFPDYYVRLNNLEKAADSYWKKKRKSISSLKRKVQRKLQRKK
ncbi:MAG: DUF5661 family protein [Sarcina sp.]